MTEAKQEITKHPPRTTTELLLIIAAIGLIVVQVATVYTSAETLRQIEAAKFEAARAADGADKKLDVIHEQTNSNLTGVNERLERAYTKIEALEKLLTKKDIDPKENAP